MRGSKAIGCPMRIKIVALSSSDPVGPWKIAYTRDGSREHNHPPSFDVRVHVAHRQRDAQRLAPVQLTQSNLMSVQADACVSTSRIHATMLATDKNTLVIPKDISNARGKARSELLASSTSIETLFKLLQSEGFHYASEVDASSGRLRYLMWAHPETTILARYFMGLLVLDCTYKTNKYRLPLLNAIVVTGMNTVLPLVQIWLPGEAEPDYTWACTKMKDFMLQNAIPLPHVILSDRELACTNATDAIFPMAAKLLCRWHIDRNVLAQARKKIGQVAVRNAAVCGKKKKDTLETEIFMAKYYNTGDAETEAEFEIRRAGLHALSESMGVYLDKEWWPHKHKFVKVWVDRAMHFGSQTTSTVEGTHASMKRWLDNSRGDLLKVFMQLLPWWVRVAKSTSYQIAKETNDIPILFRGNDGFLVITVSALTKTHELWEKAHKIVVRGLERSLCKGIYRHVHGRPCIHDLMAIIESRDELKLRPEHFDRHWWLPQVQAVAVNRVLEPATIPPRRRKATKTRSHQTGHGAKSTRRDPSSFEMIERSLPTQLETNSAPLSFQALLNGSGEEQYEQAFFPPRGWGYAGLRSLDE